MWDSMICLINYIIRYSKNTLSTDFCHEPLTILFSFDLSAWKISNFDSADLHMSSNSCSNTLEFIFCCGTSRFLWDFQFWKDLSYILLLVACLHCCHATPCADSRAREWSGRELPVWHCSPAGILVWPVMGPQVRVGCGVHLTQILIDTV